MLSDDAGEQVEWREGRVEAPGCQIAHRKGLWGRRGQLDRGPLGDRLEELRQLRAGDPELRHALHVHRPGGVVGSAVLWYARDKSDVGTCRGLSECIKGRAEQPAAAAFKAVAHSFHPGFTMVTTLQTRTARLPKDRLPL